MDLALGSGQVPDTQTWPHVFVLVDDGGLSPACTCGWFEDAPLLDENSCRAMFAVHLSGATDHPGDLQE
jgi:hypothetical protein